MAENQPRQQPQSQPSRQVVKTTTAVTVGGSLMVFSALTLAATTVLLALVTPLLVIFSPVLVPAAITLFLIIAGFLTSGGFGATATFLLYWAYQYATGKRPIGSEQIDRARARIAEVTKEVKEKAQQLGQQQ
ncbi:unnamed protein product [Ilex paraguariensis]|uniref:Oleosin n=1 Tax=Ilex paraguariensis TaxID=185542 RepID=A0ABC8UV90_9AQUA